MSNDLTLTHAVLMFNTVPMLTVELSHGTPITFQPGDSIRVVPHPAIGELMVTHAVLMDDTTPMMTVELGSNPPALVRGGQPFDIEVSFVPVDQPTPPVNAAPTPAEESVSMLASDDEDDEFDLFFGASRVDTAPIKVSKPRVWPAVIRQAIGTFVAVLLAMTVVIVALWLLAADPIADEIRNQIVDPIDDSISRAVEPLTPIYQEGP